MKKSLLLSVFISFILMFNIYTIQKAAQLDEVIPPASKIDIPVIAKREAPFCQAIKTSTQEAAPAVEPVAPRPLYISVLGRAQTPFWQAVNWGVEKAASDYGVQAIFEAPQTEQPSDIPMQFNLFKTALTKKPDAIALAAIDSKAVTPYLEEAKKAGIPVIGFDSGADSPIVKTTVATDNYGAAELAAHKMASLIDEKGKVGIIVHDQTSKTALDRRDGFVNTLKENYPNIEVLPVQYSINDINSATVLAKEFIAAHPDIKGIFGTSDFTSQGIINSIKDLNKVGQIKIIGFDSGKILVNAIREGIATGAVTQDPINIGYKAVETAIKAYEGATIPGFIDTGFAWYDQSNMDTPEIKSLLYE